MLARSLYAILLVGALLACAAQTEAPLETEEQKMLYALGFSVARVFQTMDLSESEFGYVVQGIRDGALKREERVPVQEYGTKVRDFTQKRRQAALETTKSEASGFVETMAAREGAVQLDSGVVVEEIQPGTGENPSAADTVKVHYHGTLKDGTVFDSSVQRDQPATFALNRVIKCWTEGVQKIKVGGKSRLTCPPDTAYGDRGAGPNIPPGAALVFEVELLEIVN
jgi:FKBP-type peptidyl-prolyl cis-trans isomerase FkpA/FKBP-type peptidyl-prolyl cis-trans isomerase FklB